MVPVDFKIENTIKLLSFYNDNFNPYHVAFSGGRDSVVLAWIMSKSKTNFKLHFYDNVLIPKIDRMFIKNNYSNCIIHSAKLNLMQLVTLKKRLPTRMNRFCCEYWKEGYGEGSVVVTGIRLDESFQRSLRHTFEFSRNSRFHFYKGIINPISSFTNNDINYILNREQLIISENYDIRNRNGCIGCPMSCNRKKELELLFPEYKIIWLKAIEKLFNLYNPGNFLSSSDLYKWWLSDLSVDNFKIVQNQKELDFIL